MRPAFENLFSQVRQQTQFQGLSPICQGSDFAYGYCPMPGHVHDWPADRAMEQ